MSPRTVPIRGQIFCCQGGRVHRVLPEPVMGLEAKTHDLPGAYVHYTFLLHHLLVRYSWSLSGASTC